MIKLRKEVDDSGNIFWYKIGTNILHREDGPAIEYADGAKEWINDGELHRKDGPAYESANGGKEWYKNGQRHSEAGPAVEYVGEEKEYWLYGIYYKNIESDDEWLIKQILE